jgi:hypothetical protein
MPIPAGVAAAITAATTIGGQILQNRQNRKAAENQARWNQRMADRQNQWSRDMWHLQNQYNSPIEQMARFKQAGLNPHLIYGRGNPGNATPLKSADVKAYTKPQMENVIRGINAFQDHQQLKSVKAQTDNTEAGTQVKHQQALLTAQQTALTAAKTYEQNEKNPFVRGIAKHQLEAARENVLILRNNVRKSAAEASVAEDTKDNLIESAAKKVAILGAQLDGQHLENALKAELLELRKLGIENAGPVLRMIAQITGQSSKSIMKWWDSAKKKYDPRNYQLK